MSPNDTSKAANAQWGGRFSGGPAEVMREMASSVAGARHVTLPGAGHICNIANPKGFTQALGEFFDSIADG